METAQTGYGYAAPTTGDTTAEPEALLPEQALQDSVGNLLASNLEEQGLNEQDIAFDLNAMGESLDARQFTNQFDQTTDINSYEEQASQFVEDVLTDRGNLDKSLMEIQELQTQIDDQRQRDLAAADEFGVPLEDWYKQYGQDEFAREMEMRTKLNDANASFQESLLNYIGKLDGQAQQFLSGWDKVKDSANDKNDVKTLKELRKLIGDAAQGHDSSFHQALKDFRKASSRSNDLIEAADKDQGKRKKSGDDERSAYEQSKLLRKLNIKDSDGAIRHIDKQMDGLTGKDGALQKLMKMLREQEETLQGEGKKTPSNPFLPAE